MATKTAKAAIKAIEYYLPKKIIANKDLQKENPKWNFGLIEAKTGVLSRHVAGINERASDLAVRAAEKLFRKSGIDRKTIDTLLFCTQSPDYLLPATACVIQDRLKLHTGTAAFDFNQGCSGYIYGLAIGSSLIKGGISKRVLLLCAETYSKYIRKSDRTSRTIFGDAGAATIIEGFDKERTIGQFALGTDGKGKDKIIARLNESCLHVDGAGVFMFAIQRVPECVNELLKKAKKRMDDIGLFIFHQASKVVIDNIIRILKLDESKVFRGYERIGNTVSASIPIALKQAEEQDLLKKGDLVMLVGFGVGLSWGACLIEW